MERRWALPGFPGVASDLAAEDPDLLHALLADADGGDPLRLLCGTARSRLCDRALRGEDPGAPGHWVLLVSGWFAGVWLRRQRVAGDPGSDLGMPDRAADAAALAAVAERARAGAEATPGSALAHCAEALPGWLGAYGTQRGRLARLLESPPGGCAAPPNFLRVESPLWCEIKGRPLEGLDRLWAVAQRSSLDPDQEARLDAEDAAGRRAWGDEGALPGLSAESYRGVLDLFGRSLAVALAVALTGLSALEDADAEKALQAARAGAGQALWQGAFELGWRDPASDGLGPEACLPSRS